MVYARCSINQLRAQVTGIFLKVGPAPVEVMLHQDNGYPMFVQDAVMQSMAGKNSDP